MNYPKTLKLPERKLCFYRTALSRNNEVVQYKCVIGDKTITLQVGFRDGTYRATMFHYVDVEHKTSVSAQTRGSEFLKVINVVADLFPFAVIK